jgi:hypothetical protein
MKKIIFLLLALAVFAAMPTACKQEAVKLTRADRDGIDTLVQKEIARITPELDAYCRDSSPILRKQYVDSLLIVREREISQQSVPIH